MLGNNTGTKLATYIPLLHDMHFELTVASIPSRNKLFSSYRYQPWIVISPKCKYPVIRLAYEKESVVHNLLALGIICIVQIVKSNGSGLKKKSTIDINWFLFVNDSLKYLSSFFNSDRLR